MTWHHAQSNLKGDTQRSAQGLRAAGIGIAVNAGLAILKAIVGVLGNSQALVADAIHSGGDLFNSCIAFASFLYSRRPADWDHPYGHERIEAFASTIAAVLIGVAGIIAGRDSFVALIHPEKVAPSSITLIAAGIALVSKIVLNRYVLAVARRTKSKSMMAEARDHYIDVVVSLIVIVGIIVARLGVIWFDGLAGLFVASFIIFTATQILYDAARELMDTSLSPSQRRAIIAVASNITGVRQVQAVAGRTIGHMILVELHVDVDPLLSVAEGARIVDRLKERILAEIENVRTVVVELNTDKFEPNALRLMAPPEHRGDPTHDHPGRTHQAGHGR